MPNIGFFELLLIGVVALLVLGPEKLPGAIRTTSLWVGRARRSFNKVKSEIERELNTDEIRRQLHNESILADLEDAKKKARAVVDDTRKDMDRLSKQVDESVKDINSLKDAAAANPALLDETPKSATGTASPTPAIEPPTDDTTTAAPAPVTAESNAEPPDTASVSEPEPELEPEPEPPKKAPPQDFYNNPGVGVIELREGRFQPAQTPTGNDDKSGSSK